MTSEAKTPKELADAVRVVIPGYYIPSHAETINAARTALSELERIAAEKPMQESLCARVARLEDKVGGAPVVEFKTNPNRSAIQDYDQRAFQEWFVQRNVGPACVPVQTFENELAALCGRHRLAITVSKVVRNTDLRGFEMVKESGQEPLPPAESCAHAVERFRDALELLAKRHEVEVEIGGISPGSVGGGIEDLPDAGELDAEYRAQFDEPVRERKAWDTIEAWQDKAPASEVRNVERSTSQALKLEKRAFSGCNGSTCTITSQVFYSVPRLGALEAAAAWCEGQK